MINLGRIAYEAYGKTRQWRTFAGDPMPLWDKQTPELRAAWEAAAEAVAKAVEVTVQDEQSNTSSGDA
jgi:hypothetical protein